MIIKASKKTLIALVVIFSLLLSSCGLLSDESQSAEEISNTVDGFLSSDDPQVVAAAFLEAISLSDFEAISSLSNFSYDEAEFIDSSFSISADLFELVFDDLQYTIVDEDVSEDAATIYFQISVSPFDDALYVIGSDTDLMVDAIIQPLRLATERPEDDVTVVFSDYMNMVMEAIYDYLSVLDKQSNVDIDIEVNLAYSHSLATWYVSGCSHEFFTFSDLFYTYDPLYSLDDDERADIFMTAFEALYQSGQISLEQYDLAMIEWGNVVPEQQDYSAQDVLDAIVSISWFDLEIWEYVEEYEEGVYTLNVDVVYSEYLPGLVLVCDFYADDGEAHLYTTDPISLSAEPGGYYYTEFTFSSATPEPLPAGQYLAVISLTDGTVLVESSIDIS